MKTVRVVEGELDDGAPGTYVITAFGKCAVSGIRPHAAAVQKLTKDALRKLRSRVAADTRRLEKDG